MCQLHRDSVWFLAEDQSLPFPLKFSSVLLIDQNNALTYTYHTQRLKLLSQANCPYPPMQTDCMLDTDLAAHVTVLAWRSGAFTSVSFSSPGVGWFCSSPERAVAGITSVAM